jgi:small subunit ribosomal protein S2
MSSVSMRQLLEAGVHFGHQTRRWNPKMKPFIFAERNGIHIIDLAQTVSRLDAALAFVTETVANGDYVLFVGTKKQAQEPIAEEAARAEMPWVNHRWLGGMLTNFVTIRKRVGRLDQIEAMQTSGDLERRSKKEASGILEEMARLQLKLGGVRKMRRLPGAIFVVDPQREHIAVTEARRLEIPVIGTGDTNVDPDQIDYIIPANDDAIRAIRLLCRLVSDAAIEGLARRATRGPSDAAMSADIAEAEEASDEVMAAIAAGGTYSFVPEPDEDETVLPGEDDLLADASAEALLAGEPVAAAEEVEEEQPRASRPRARKSATAPAEAVEEAESAPEPAAAPEPVAATKPAAAPEPVAATKPAAATKPTAAPEPAAATKPAKPAAATKPAKPAPATESASADEPAAAQETSTADEA